MSPEYPVYVISKGRHDCCLTAKCLKRDGVPFRIVVEPQEAELYADQFGKKALHVLPFSNLGLGSIPARNWVWQHSIKSKARRHWILDDNIRNFYRRYEGLRVPCLAGIALRMAEIFTDRYENVALSGLNYKSFGFYGSGSKLTGLQPFQLNCHVYSCILILNSLLQRWRGRYNEDTDLCLQVLSAGWCTVLINAFLADKVATMTMKGGNTAQLYQGDGRLKMSRSLERMWPGVVRTTRKFNRPQHQVFDNWQRFDTPLKLRSGIKLGAGSNEHGIKLKKIAEVKGEIALRIAKKLIA